MAAPGGHGPIGPFPPGVETDQEREDYDRQRRRLLRTLPYGLYVVSSMAGDRRNAMTLNWASQVSFEPKLVAIGVERTALTHQLIEDGGAFVLHTIAREDRAVVRKFTKPVLEDGAARTLNGFAYRDGTSGLPVLELAVSYLECQVRDRLVCGGHTLFVGEVIDGRFQRAEDTELLRMEDTRMDYGG
ncbi:MAG: flavin reductase family protein [Acidimicrobiales bacterium]